MVDFSSPPADIIKPIKLAHVVLRTGNFDVMVEFYKTFLGSHVTHQNQFIALLAYDEEHHRIGIANVKNTVVKDPKASGLEHIAFAFSSLPDLLLAYRQRKARGLPPGWCVNHGMTTSIYYKDPDGNTLETVVDHFDNERTHEYMQSEEFLQNPIGVDFDPESLIKRIESGEKEETLFKRGKGGPRTLESIPLLAH